MNLSFGGLASLARAVLLLAASGSALAEQAGGPVTVSFAWARATPRHATGSAIYLVVSDIGAPDRLTGATTPVAAEATLHESRMVGGIMQMRAVGPLDVAPGKAISLAPGGLHLMLTGLRTPLLAGQHFPVTLQFEKAGAVTADVTVEKIGAAGPAGIDMRMGNGQ